MSDTAYMLKFHALLRKHIASKWSIENGMCLPKQSISLLLLLSCSERFDISLVLQFCSSACLQFCSGVWMKGTAFL